MINSAVSGIYKITHIESKRIYVGSACNVARRISLHKWQLKKECHHSKYLQRAWKKYGAEAFEFSLILRCAETDLLFYEQRAIDKLDPKFNTSPTAGSTLGLRHTEKQKIANSNRCKIQRGTPKWRAEQSVRLKKAYAEGRLAGNVAALTKYQEMATPEMLRAKYTEEVKEKIRTSAKARGARYEFQGRMLTLLQIAEMTGLEKATLKERIKRGLSIDDAAMRPTDIGKRRGGLKKYTLNGEPVGLVEITGMTGFNKSSIYRWLKSGITPEEILAEGFKDTASARKSESLRKSWAVRKAGG